MIYHIQFQNVSHKYGERQVLNDISFGVNQGEIAALIGANGSGKTTLLRIVAGLEEPTEGRIIVRGNQASFAVLRKITTMVFQKTVTFNASVHENIAYGLKARGMASSEIEKKVRSVLKTVGLEGFEERRAKKLSGGEQQRVSLARALAVEPEIILLDEPTANIDPKNASIIESVISGVNHDLGTTIIMASHNMMQAKKLASKIAALQDGVLLSFTNTSEIFDKPSTVLESINRLQNIFSGKAHQVEGGLTIVDVGNDVRFEAAGAKQGPVTVFIRPEDIIISKMPLISSARNVLKGKVMEASGRNELIQLKVDAGKEFVTVVTRKSFEEMKLNIGSEVYLTFKAQAVQLVS